MYSYADQDTVIDRINRRFDELVVTRSDGSKGPYVCIVCDRMLKPNNVEILSTECLKENMSILTPSTWNAVDSSIAQCYMYAGETQSRHDRNWLMTMLLSPRGSYMQTNDGKYC